MQYIKKQEKPYIYEAIMRGDNIIIESQNELSGKELDLIMENTLHVQGISLLKLDNGKEVKVTNKNFMAWSDEEQE